MAMVYLKCGECGWTDAFYAPSIKRKWYLTVDHPSHDEGNVDPAQGVLRMDHR